MREYELEVLDQYHMEVISTRKIRGAFFIDTNEGTMLLRETDISDRRAPLLYLLLTHLEAEGYAHVDTPVFTKEGKLIATSREGRRYILKKWYGGRECDVRRESDVLEAVANLAGLHEKLRWQPQCEIAGEAGMQALRENVEGCGAEPQSMRENAEGRGAESQSMCENEAGRGAKPRLAADGEVHPPTGRHLLEEFLCHNRELKKIRGFVRKKSSKDSFDYLFLAHFDRMFSVAEQVTDQLKQSGYDELYLASVTGNCLVHGDYNYHNVLMLPAAEVATTNFEHFCLDVQVQDLCYFLRKVMEKHQWNEGLGDAMLGTYGKIRPLKREELEYMALKLAYPEKFWKTMNSYYHSNKVWVPEKNVEKLMLSVTQTDEKIRFLEKIFSFHL